MTVRDLASRRVLAVALLAIVVAACSKKDDVAPAATNAASEQAQAATATEQERPTVCTMITAEEMSGLVGTPVAVEGEAGVGTTKCRYKPPASTFPLIEIEVDWGSGAAAMVGTGMLGRAEPGISNPLAGLGDEAVAVGPAFMIRVGDDFLNVMLMGVDDHIGVAKRIVALMRPKMGSSAQAKGAVANGSDTADAESEAEAAAVAQAMGSLLGGIDAATSESNADRAEGGNRADGASGDGNADSARSGGRADSARGDESAHGAGSGRGDGTPRVGSASASVRPAGDEPALGAATGAPVRIPLVAGLKLIAAENEPGRGDYEPIVSIASVTKDRVSTVFSANLPEGSRLVVQRDVRGEDFSSARELLSWYEQDDPRVFAGTTSFSLSTAIYNDLKTKGRAEIVRRGSRGNSLLDLVQAVAAGGSASAPRHTGKLERVEPHAVAFPVLLNDEPVQLHAIHARGTFDDATIDFVVLDDAENPLLLRLAGGSTGRIVRIVLPTQASTPIEKKLQDEARVALHGIYFDFGKDTIRPESEAVLRDIAAALTHHPDWKIGIEGHTDNIGGDTPNLDLSQRRAAAVKQALVERYHVPAANLSTAGLGASRPTDSNETASGRARNRRVELVR